MVFFRATRSDAKSDVRKGKAHPARRFESVRRHSQERFRTRPSLRGLDRAVAPDDGGPGFLAFKGIVAIPAPELGAPTLAKCILQDRIKGPRGRRLGNVTGKVVPEHLSRHPWASSWSACAVNPNASNSRLNSFALALRSGDRGSPRDIFRAARYALDSRIKSRRCNPSPSTALRYCGQHPG
jgi:hypothetical protein